MLKQPSSSLRKSLRTLMSFACAIIVGVAVMAPSDLAAQGAKRGASGLPLPRYVSLKADKVNMRIGPGIDYAIAWRYMRAGVPMEIIQEYDNWRKVRDFEGEEGWINQALLSGERTAIAAPWMRKREEDIFIAMFRDKDERSKLVARLKPGVIVAVEGCDGTWCEAEIDGAHGFVSQQEIWGAYPGEAFR